MKNFHPCKKCLVQPACDKECEALKNQFKIFNSQIFIICIVIFTSMIITAICVLLYIYNIFNWVVLLILLVWDCLGYITLCIYNEKPHLSLFYDTNLNKLEIAVILGFLPGFTFCIIIQACISKYYNIYSPERVTREI